MRYINICETISDDWIVTVNGYQWGHNDSVFDFAAGCSGQTWETKTDALDAWNEYGKATDCELRRFGDETVTVEIN